MSTDEENTQSAAINESDSEDKQQQKRANTDLEKLEKYFFNLHDPILGICDQTGQAFITYFQDAVQITTLINKVDFQHVVIKDGMDCKIKSGNLRLLSERFLDLLMAKAIYRGSKFSLERRIGKSDEKIYVNLNRMTGEFVEIDSEGWKIVNKSPVYFLTSPKDLPLPVPVQTTPQEFLSIWKKYFNFTHPPDHYLALAFSVKGMMPGSGANPILVIEGDQGSGKTTTSIMLKLLIDPTRPAVYGTPKSERDFAIQAISSFFIVIDNSSGFNGELSDVLCRASTGGGISMRVLYQTDEERVYNITKPIAVNGIEELTDRADFVERALILPLKPLLDANRISESEYWRQFYDDYAVLIGGLYSLIAFVKKELPSIKTDGLLRMGEYQRVGLALDKAFGLKEGHFTEILQAHHIQKQKTIFENDLLCQLIAEALKKHEEIKGSTTEVMKIVYRGRIDKSSMTVLPKDPRRFKGKLQRLRAVFEANGIECGDLGRTSNCRGIYLRKSSYKGL